MGAQIWRKPHYIAETFTSGRNNAAPTKFGGNYIKCAKLYTLIGFSYRQCNFNTYGNRSGYDDAVEHELVKKQIMIKNNYKDN